MEYKVNNLDIESNIIYERNSLLRKYPEVDIEILDLPFVNSAIINKDGDTLKVTKVGSDV